MKASELIQKTLSNYKVGSMGDVQIHFDEGVRFGLEWAGKMAKEIEAKDAASFYIGTNQQSQLQVFTEIGGPFDSLEEAEAVLEDVKDVE